MIRWLTILAACAACLVSTAAADDRLDPWSGRWVTTDKDAAAKQTGEILAVAFARKDGELWVEFVYGPAKVVGGGFNKGHKESHAMRCVCLGRETKDGGARAQGLLYVSRRGVCSTYMLQGGGRAETGGWSVDVTEFQEDFGDRQEPGKLSKRSARLVREK